MRLEEFDSFRGEIKQLCASLGKAYTDALGQAYWRVLKDIPLEELESNVERILLNATADTKFPRPQSLRTTPAPRQTSSLESDPALKKALERNKLNWDEKFKTNPPLANWHMLSGYLARIDVEEDPSSVFYAERMADAKAFAQRLYKEYGPKWCVADSHCMHAASRLLGGDAIHARHNALWRTGA